jgi:hypothetical protein
MLQALSLFILTNRMLPGETQTPIPPLDTQDTGPKLSNYETRV